MNTVTTLSAENLLAIQFSEPERLFTGDEEIARQEFRALAARWHPDRCPDAGTTGVFQHINRLYEAAVRKLRGGIWHTPGLLVARATDGATYQIRYRRERAFELGRLFMGREIVAWVVGREHTDLFQNALQTINRLPCANARMAAEVGRYLPEIVRHFETGEGWVLVVRKASDLVLLRDVLDYSGGRMDARHVAWIISSLLNLACYLDYAQLAHNAILTDTWFISPPQHSGALLGGWWYAVRQGEPMTAAPARTVQYAPFDVLDRKRGDRRTDRELIRALGRELLGDVTGVRLARAKAAPAPMLDWLRLPAGDSALHDYQTWMNQVLKASFGERRFVTLEITTDDLH
ncbi:MAG TPA: J domain-containing protein [Candidatus Contendobacter sp.]|nr:J domain-containing protein [Candidatus Contendobacter sp.]